MLLRLFRRPDQDGECGAMSFGIDGAAHADTPAILSRKLLNDPEAQTGARLAFGGDERLKDGGQQLRVDPRSSVRHGDTDLLQACRRIGLEADSQPEFSAETH